MNPGDSSAAIQETPGASLIAAPSPVPSDGARRVKKKRRVRSKRRRSIKTRLLRGLPFIFPSYLGRIPFALRMVFCVVLLMFSTILEGSYWSSIISGPDAVSPFSIISGMMFIVGHLYIAAFVLAPRLSDAGLPRWLAILAFVPVLKYPVLIGASFLPSGAFLEQPRF